MYLQHDEWRSAIYLLALLLLLSIAFASCDAPWMQPKKPLPTLTVEPGWEKMIQTSGDTTNQSQEKSQNFTLNNVSANTHLRLSITCIGSGSATIQIRTPFTAVATATCTSTPRIVSTDSVVDTPQKQLTINILGSGSVKWDALVEKLA